MIPIRNAAKLVLALMVVFFTPDQSGSQDISLLPVTRNPDYDAAVLFRNVQSELHYVNRLDGPLPFENMPMAPPENSEIENNSNNDGLFNNANRLLLAVLLALLIFVLFKYGKRARDGFARSSHARSTRERPRRQTEEQRTQKRARTQELIAKLLDMEDREAAFVELIHHVLNAAAEQNELRLGHSETARDFVRRLPRDWGYLSDLRRIIIAEELVQFGGRPLIARTFEDCLRRATPILDAVRI